MPKIDIYSWIPRIDAKIDSDKLKLLFSRILYEIITVFISTYSRDQNTMHFHLNIIMHKAQRSL